MSEKPAKPKRPAPAVARSDYQPTQEELEQNVSIPCEPDELLAAVIQSVQPSGR